MKKVKKMENGPSFDNSFVNKTLPTTSISTILSMLQEPFDQKGVAEKTFNKRFNDPTSEYYQMTVEQIIEKWEDKAAASRRYGKLNDDYIGIVLEGTEDDKDLFLILDRPSAILKACQLAGAGDTVLFLGKGNEKTIERAHGADAYYELDEIKKAIKKVKKIAK